MKLATLLFVPLLVLASSSKGKGKAKGKGRKLIVERVGWPAFLDEEAHPPIVTRFVATKNGMPISFEVQFEYQNYVLDPMAALNGADNAWKTSVDERSDDKYSVLVNKGGEEFAVDARCCGYEINIRAATKTREILPNTHNLIVNWNSQGHAPPGVYDVAHYDLHWYYVSERDRLKIRQACENSERCEYEPGFLSPVDCPTLTKCASPLPDDMLPPDYVYAPGCEPAMGNHLIDFTGPEFIDDGVPGFDHTFIHGYYDGKLTFAEPMIAIAFMKEFAETHAVNEEVCFPIKWNENQVMAQAGYYPTAYCFCYDGNAVIIKMKDFTHFEQYQE